MMRNLSIFFLNFFLIGLLSGQIPDKSVPVQGSIIWRSQPIGENIEATPAVDNDGNIYTTGGGKIWCFTKSGEVKWSTCPLYEGCRGVDQKYPYPLGVASSPAISPDGKKVYITGYAGVFAFNTSDGKLLWKRTVFKNFYEFAEMEFKKSIEFLNSYNSKKYPFVFATTPAISFDGRKLYAGAGDNDYPHDSFYCINTENGSVIWEYEMKHPPLQIEEGNYTRGYLGGACLGPDGTIYIASQHGWLISLTDKGESYSENWAYKVGAEMRMPPAMDSEGFLYVGSSSAGGYIHKINSRTGKKAPGLWPVKTNADEVFAAIVVGSDGTIYANSEDHRLWAFNSDGSIKWSNLIFDHWGGDPLIRADDRIIFTAQYKDSARVVCVRDDIEKGTLEWASPAICDSLAFNETNVNISPDGTIYVHSGVYPPKVLYAIQGNGFGLSKSSPWAKYMGSIQNSGSLLNQAKKYPVIHDPSELQFENGYFMVFSTGEGIQSWYREEAGAKWKSAGILDKPSWWDATFPDNEGYFWAPCVPKKWILYYSFEADDDHASAIGRAVATGTAPNLKWKDDGQVLIMPACRDNGKNCPVAIDPSVFSDDTGNLYMSFGSGTSGIWIVELNSETGHLSEVAAKGFSEDNPAFHRVAYRRMGNPRGPTDYIEASYVYHYQENGYYYLFVNWGQCCSGLASTYQIMVGRSKSPIGPYLDRTGKDMVDEGGSLLLKTEGRFIGPGHAGIYKYNKDRYAFSFHYYDGENNGKARLAVRDLEWINDWPVVGKTNFFNEIK